MRNTTPALAKGGSDISEIHYPMQDKIYKSHFVKQTTDSGVKLSFDIKEKN